MDNKITYEEFIKILEIDVENPPPFIRKGQALMNCLAEYNMDLYNEITESDDRCIDCFYNDKYIPKTKEYIKKRWYGE